MNKFLIGIDPDVYKSGIAIQCEDIIKLDNVTFFELFDMLYPFKEKEFKPIIYIECGFLNKSNWHQKINGSASLNSRIGAKTGANHEIAKKIVEMCEYLKIPHLKIKPTRTKLNAESFKSITGIIQKTNQEQRDAFMLIFGR